MLAYRSLPILVRWLPDYSFPHEVVIGVNLPVLAFAVMIAILTGVLFEIAPAFHFSRPQLAQLLAINRSSRTATWRGTRSSRQSSGPRRTYSLASRCTRSADSGVRGSSSPDVRSTTSRSCLTSVDSVIPSRSASLRTRALVSNVTRQAIKACSGMRVIIKRQRPAANPACVRNGPVACVAGPCLVSPLGDPPREP